MNQPEDPQDDNIIRLPSKAERAKMDAEKKKAAARTDHVPLINLPPFTKFMLLSFLALHILTDVILPPPQQFWVFTHFGFVPAYYSGTAPGGWAAFAGPFTFTFLHGNWTHMILNGLMLMAFGTGVEKWMGGKRLLVFFMCCNLLAALAQFILDPSSTAPVIGASGGLSGLFAAVLVMMQQQNGLGAGNRYGIWPFVLLWIVISVVFGLIGGPGNSSIAWAAHIGGFLAGFVLLKPILKSRRLD
ncbi:MAG: rhomboid family intramembrane serine protease [Micavibrio sp.]